MNETAVRKERAVLAGLSALSMEVRERSSDVSMEELASLVETAGGEPVAVIMQNLPSPNTHSFIGEGKVPHPFPDACTRRGTRRQGS